MSEQFVPTCIFKDDLFEQIQPRLAEGPFDLFELFQLASLADDALLAPSFDELLCLEHLPKVIPYPHQISAAKRVLTDLHGRAILADEVGLGKTIEAGLILKEYMLRGLVKKALILVPASLVLQWTRELNGKFDVNAFAQRNEWSWTSYDVIVASIDTTKRDPHRSAVLGQEWDLVIVDEAHKLKNNKTKNWQIINELHKKYLLLLTATPIQNDLKELFNLITLLKPGQLGNFEQFRNSFVLKKRTPKNAVTLRSTVSDVMIRNKRKDGGVFFTERVVQQISLQLSEHERNFYNAVSAFIREQYIERKAARQNVLPLITLQREICSSAYAALCTLERMQKDAKNASVRERLKELQTIGESIPEYTKIRKVVELVQTINDKVIIFTEYRATQDFIMYMLEKNGVRCVSFRGGFKRGKKDWMKELFEKKAQVLVATEAGGEGINLQFCNRVINYDLPWNPMRVEQRIGRVHRMGQTRDVYIYNMATINTVEEYIVRLLSDKIRMFELVIGELDLILGKWKNERTLEGNIMDYIVESSSSEDLGKRIEEMGDVVLQERVKLEAMREISENVETMSV